MSDKDNKTKKKKDEKSSTEKLIQYILFGLVAVILIMVLIIITCLVQQTTMAIKPAPEFNLDSMEKPNEDQYQTVDFKTIRALTDPIFPSEVSDDDLENKEIITPAESILKTSYWLNPQKRSSFKKPYFYIINARVYIRYDRTYNELHNKLNYVNPFVEIIIKKTLERQKLEVFSIYSLRKEIIAQEIKDEINYYLQYPKSYIDYFIGENKHDILYLSLPYTIEKKKFEEEIAPTLTSSQKQAFYEAYEYIEQSYIYKLKDELRDILESSETTDTEFSEELEEVRSVLSSSGFLIGKTEDEENKEVKKEMILESVIVHNFIYIKKTF